ncbi:hypothetical protein FUAX_28270 [Fulvitalea axinellae]|uniref:Secretion system C-terminal sorting domain-containing protein n=1 Tax=Fulvitalea axinellae TaxID=1182444 RepID=A0AAU9DD84_9BACT|nr:hypothetical protein FUAX_28270 [Fulvitalea axinellae]
MKKILTLSLLVTLALFAEGQGLKRYNTLELKVAGKPLSMPWFGGVDATQLASSDLDGDGKEDLILYSRAGNRLRVLLNTDGNYIHSPNFENTLPDNINGWMVWVDYDKDGKADIFTKGLLGVVAIKRTDDGKSPAWEVTADPIYTQKGTRPVNLQVASDDIPAIHDIDADGDLDIFLYDFSIGSFVRHHKNLSVEETGKAGALSFTKANDKWGDFEECDCYFVFGENICSEESQNRQLRTEHVGGKSLLIVDDNKDGLPDLWAGHEQCDQVYAITNNGSAGNILMREYRPAFPLNNQPSHMLYPVPYQIDADLDGKKDVIVATNFNNDLSGNTDYSQSIFWHKNTGDSYDNTAQPFLSDKTLDLGSQTAPVAADFTNDGKTDLLVAYDKSGFGGVRGAFALLENTGTTENPKFELKDNDFGGWAKLGRMDLRPVIVDADGDKTPELAVAYIAADGKTLKTEFAELGETPTPERFSAWETPFGKGDHWSFFDLDDDGSEDLFLGKKSGRLEYYKTTYENGTAIFTLIEKNFAGKDDHSLRRNLASTFISGKSPILLTTDLSGNVSIHKKAGDTFVLQEEKAIVSDLGDRLPANLSSRTAFAQARLRPGGPLLIFVGTAEGGLELFAYTDKNHDDSPIHIYPNPVENGGELKISVSEKATISVFDTTGRRILNDFPSEAGSTVRIPTVSWATGVYIVVAETESGKHSKRVTVR